MNIKLSFIDHLKKILENKEGNNLGRSKVELKDLLYKIESNEYNSILTKSNNITLYKLSEFDFYRKKNQSKSLLKDYRLFCIAEDIDKKIATTSNLEKLKSKIEKFLKNVQDGNYDELLSTESFWFWTNIDTEVLIEWDNLRNKTNNKNLPTMSNYIVFNVYLEIIKQFIIYFNNYKDNSLFHHKTSVLIKEFKIYKKLAKELASLNYNWKEAKNVVQAFKDLNISAGCDIAHNIEEIKKIFIPKRNTVYHRFEETNLKSTNLDEIKKRAQSLAMNLTPDNLLNIYLNDDEDKIDNYLRKMITSQFDFQRISKALYNILNEEQLEFIFKNPRYYKHEIKTIYKKLPKKRKEKLYFLSYGVLASIFSYHKQSKIKILSDAIRIQENLNCSQGIVSSYDTNIIKLLNGETIYSLPREFIKKYFASYQAEYDYYRKNSKTDLEYIDGCVEILGHVMLSQIFLIGNKRTSKCLFNAMLVTRGIIPPVLDFCNNELWESFAYYRDSNYLNAKKIILEKTINLNQCFEKENLSNQNSKEYIKRKKA